MLAHLWVTSRVLADGPVVEALEGELAAAGRLAPVLHVLQAGACVMVMQRNVTA